MALWVLAIVAIGLFGLFARRRLDLRADRVEMARLRAFQPTDPPRFSADMVADLPEPARRFFTFAIAEGTPLYTVARLEMQGRFGMGDKSAPGYMPMRATQVLAAPHGFVWAMSGGASGMRLSGSDSAKWTRFWIAGLAPVARFGGSADHKRSAFGRYVAEAVFWAPAAVLPGPNVTWEPVSANIARMTMRHDGLEQAVDLTVAEDGRPEQVRFQRWSNANPQKRHRLQPFGGYLSEFRDLEGFRLPTHVEAGNDFESEAYFPFYIADVTDIRFLK
ncbi:DUF6544 family protein [Thioclava electrotropha]|uniref:Uncharacterized protein n=1 Tax=Thioclava electrotropha TaxID=1549850 RepID=A0ABX6YVG8_9RHOB|nr:DUF6544 family protein [Thioclava electrotropha]QPZ91733.1 hypothetical protein AKL02_013085 [Thioclava electrotropha]